MRSTGKHFPGHGGVYEDSHLQLPIDNRSMEDLIDSDIKPYTELKDKLDIVMCGHILFPEIDANIPSFSSTWIQDILKKELNYQGLIISDDLSMEGAAGENCSIKIRDSFQAGCDMAIICNNRDEVKKALSFLDDIKIEPINNISNMKKVKDVDWHKLQSNQRAIKTKDKLKKIRS
jgi:beta-N-acetylhexosaminidase